MRGFVSLSIVVWALVWTGLAVGQTAPEANVGDDVVSFDGQTLVLAAQGANDGEQVLEFIHRGENLDAWTRLASVRV